MKTANEIELAKAIAAASLQKTDKRIKERFIEACENNLVNPNYNTRMVAVAYQYNRDIWQIIDQYGRIEISKKTRDAEEINFGMDKHTFHITAFFFVLGPCGFRLTEAEYEEMKKIYFGNFIP